MTEIVSSAGDVDCELFDPQGVPQALCEGSVSANTRATVIFKVKFDKCTCDDDNKCDLYGYMHVLTPTDPNLNNNFDNRQHALTNPNSTTCSDDICPDPITQLTITSHVTGQIVSTQQVTLTGTVA